MRRLGLSPGLMFGALAGVVVGAAAALAIGWAIAERNPPQASRPAAPAAAAEVIPAQPATDAPTDAANADSEPSTAEIRTKPALETADKNTLLKAARLIIKERETGSGALLGSWANSSAAIIAIEAGLALTLIILALLASLQRKTMSALRSFADTHSSPTKEEWAQLMSLLIRQHEDLQGVKERLSKVENRKSAEPGSSYLPDTPPMPPLPPRIDLDDPRDRQSDVQAVLADYAKVVANREDETPNFERTYSPRVLRAFDVGSDEFISEPTSGTVWAVPIQSQWILLPGPGPIARWYNYQAAAGGTAKEAFGGAYDLMRGSDVLRIAKPAWAEEVGGRFRVKEKGVLAGVP